MKRLSEMSLEELIDPQGISCSCGKQHKTEIKHIKIGNNALEVLPEVLQELAIENPLFIYDQNTYQAAWKYLEPIIKAEKINYAEFIYQAERLEPDEKSLGSLVMIFDRDYDGIVVVGSGVLNDLGKVFAHAVGVPQIVIATAASMDGYGSNNASMIQNGLKVSLYNACPLAIIADTRILKAEPEQMLQAGLGDMLAKYVSLSEWKISNLIAGEYYCENIADLVRSSLKKIINSADGLLHRDEQAIENVFEGLLLTGLAMSFAGISRPASGLEHYFSHVWEMMSLERGETAELHGIQVAVGTLLSVQIWDQLLKYQPDQQKALQFINSFDSSEWEKMVCRIYGEKTAKQIIKTANSESRNSKSDHAVRLSKILDLWPQIIQIVEYEMPTYTELQAYMEKFNLPLTPQEIGYTEQDKQDALIGSREVRNKYVTSSLLWDLGLLYEIKI